MDGLTLLRVGTLMKIGHVCLGNRSDADRDRFIAVVAALDRAGIDQHVLVSSVTLARQLADLPHVSVGPVVRTPVMAYCLMPDVDLAHVHEARSGQAGLLLTLTRSMPYVLTADNEELGSRNPLTRSVIRRAVQLLPTMPGEHASRVAAEYLEVYRNAVSNWVRDVLAL